MRRHEYARAKRQIFGAKNNCREERNGFGKCKKIKTKLRNWNQYTDRILKSYFHVIRNIPFFNVHIFVLEAQSRNDILVSD